ncbi:MAG: thiopurine S-methyltransferase [Spongiibacteraceae bacterium]
MEADFWLQRWRNNEIGFHASEVNPMLVEYFQALSLGEGSRVFVPLCGKTLDITWLLSKGYRVAGAELSKQAVEQLFIGLGVEPAILKLDGLEHYRANNIDVFVGDIFDLSSQVLGPVDAIYDRAALVALPTAMRKRYAAHLMAITNNASQLLISYEYDQRLMEGPPFSVSNDAVKQLYSDNYQLNLLKSDDVAGGLKGQYAAVENVWSLIKLM